MDSWALIDLLCHLVYKNMAMKAWQGFENKMFSNHSTLAAKGKKKLDA